MGRHYETLNHTFFIAETPFNRVCPWKRDFAIESDCNFSFMVQLPHSRFAFTHLVQPIIEEVNYNAEVDANLNTLAVKVYDPPPSGEYVRCVEEAFLITREALGTTLQHRDYVEKEANKWFLIGD